MSTRCGAVRSIPWSAPVTRCGAGRRRFVHELLGFLERSGWGGAPRFLGVDEQGREILTFVDGYVPWRSADVPGVTAEASLVRVAELVREFHDLTAGTPLAGDDEVVCHNDLAPNNTVYSRCGAGLGDGDSGLRPTAFIDWDLAGPGRRPGDHRPIPARRADSRARRAGAARPGFVTPGCRSDRRELRTHASRARVGLIPIDDAAGEEAEGVLITEIAVASGNLRTGVHSRVARHPSPPIRHAAARAAHDAPRSHQPGQAPQAQATRLLNLN